jgi:hypothetical protein
MAPLTLLSPVCRLRKVFVAERCGLEPAPGPKNSQSCTIMGNSEKSWSLHYDKNASLRDTQAAADGSLAWRDALLSSGLQKLSAVPVPDDDEEMEE